LLIAAVSPRIGQDREVERSVSDPYRSSPRGREDATGVHFSEPEGSLARESDFRGIHRLCNEISP